MARAYGPLLRGQNSWGLFKIEKQLALHFQALGCQVPPVEGCCIHLFFALRLLKNVVFIYFSLSCDHNDYNRFF